MFDLARSTVPLIIHLVVQCLLHFVPLLFSHSFLSVGTFSLWETDSFVSFIDLLWFVYYILYHHVAAMLPPASSLNCFTLLCYFIGIAVPSCFMMIPLVLLDVDMALASSQFHNFLHQRLENVNAFVIHTVIFMYQPFPIHLF